MSPQLLEALAKDKMVAFEREAGRRRLLAGARKGARQRLAEALVGLAGRLEPTLDLPSQEARA